MPAALIRRSRADAVKDAMLSVSAASGANNGEVISAAELLVSIDSNMYNIGVSTEETFSAISVMKNDLKKYRV